MAGFALLIFMVFVSWKLWLQVMFMIRKHILKPVILNIRDKFERIGYFNISKLKIDVSKGIKNHDLQFTHF